VQRADQLRLQSRSLGGAWLLTVLQKALIHLPERFVERLQESRVVRKVGDQFLVMAIFMNPAQCQFFGQPVELGGIIAE